MNTFQPRFKTTAACRAWFRAHGINVSAWAREHGFKRQVVVDLLHDRIKGFRGEAHRAAVALGLKADPADFDAEAAQDDDPVTDLRAA